jgi:5-methyltetrahydrofolate--homocysteine methyltransferase
MAIASGMTSAITNPMHEEIMQSVRGADVVMGHDAECANWIAVNRDPNADSRQRRGRRGGRSRGRG